MAVRRLVQEFREPLIRYLSRRSRAFPGKALIEQPILLDREALGHHECAQVGVLLADSTPASIPNCAGAVVVFIGELGVDLACCHNGLAAEGFGLWSFEGSLSLAGLELLVTGEERSALTLAPHDEG